MVSAVKRVLRFRDENQGTVEIRNYIRRDLKFPKNILLKELYLVTQIGSWSLI